MCDHIANDRCCLDCSGIWAGVIIGTNEHGDGDLVDASEVNELRFLNKCIVVCKLLVPILEGILPPVSLRLDRDRLAPRACPLFAGFCTDLLANSEMILLPVRSPDRIDTV